MESKAIEKRVMRFFWKFFIVLMVLTPISAVFPYPFNQIIMLCGVTSLGFGFGMLATVSIIQEVESHAKS